MRLCAGNRYIIRGGVFSVLFPPAPQTQTLFLHTYIQPIEAMSAWMDRVTLTGRSAHDRVTATCDPISDIVRLHEYWFTKAVDDRAETEMHRLVLTGMMTCSGRYARQWCNDHATAYTQLNRLSLIEQTLRRRGRRVRPRRQASLWNGASTTPQRPYVPSSFEPGWDDDMSTWAQAHRLCALCTDVHHQPGCQPGYSLSAGTDNRAHPHKVQRLMTRRETPIEMENQPILMDRLSKLLVDLAAVMDQLRKNTDGPTS
jgi:hypothetical protein